MILVRLFYIVGTALIALSFYLNYWLGKRRFNRRNSFGTELYSSYGKSLFIAGWENMVAFFSTLFRVVGIIMLVAAFFDPQGIIQLQYYYFKPHIR